MRIISVPHSQNCFHMLLFSNVTETPLKVSTAGKSVFSASGLPNVAGGNVETQGGESEMESRLAPGLFRESDAEAICEVAGLWSNVCSSIEVGETAGLAGLASAGEGRAELHSLRATEMALLSITVSVAKLGFAIGKWGGSDEGTEIGGSVSGTSGNLPSSSSS